MKTSLGVATLFFATVTVRQEPAPRQPAPIAIKVTGDFATISGAWELRDGRLLLSDATKAAVFLVDPKAGTTRQIGSAGGGQTQYAQPGGFYAGVADTVYLLDRAQARFLVISPKGDIIASRSIKQKGVSGSSSADQDYQQVDSRGLAYFTDRAGRLRGAIGGVTSDSLALLRFDETRQHYDTVAMLRQAEKKITQMDEHMQFTRSVHGSPEDGWGMASDGSIAVVRASPYRVDWHSRGGSVIRGSAISYEPIPFTSEEKAAFTAANNKAGGGVSATGTSGTQVTSQDVGELFAPTKAAFDPAGIIVSPDGHLWVRRSQRAAVKTVLYDVFDKRGERVDRVELPPRSRVIGFGTNAVYAVERDDSGTPSLRKYKTQEAGR